MADTWVNMGTIPFRVALDENFCDGGLSIRFQESFMMNFMSPENMIEFVWRHMLAAAASESTVEDSVLLRYIKDAVDHGCLVSDFEKDERRGLQKSKPKGTTSTTENGDDEADEKEQVHTHTHNIK